MNLAMSTICLALLREYKESPIVSDRKLTLFACAIYRLLEEEEWIKYRREVSRNFCLKLIEEREFLADDPFRSMSHLKELHKVCPGYWLSYGTPYDIALEASTKDSDYKETVNDGTRCDVFRHIFGNGSTDNKHRKVDLNIVDFSSGPFSGKGNLVMNTKKQWPEEAVRLAQTIYDKMGVKGEDPKPIFLPLSDILEEIGELEMAHDLRTTKYCCKGYWVIDEILNKE